MNMGPAPGDHGRAAPNARDNRRSDADVQRGARRGAPSSNAAVEREASHERATRPTNRELPHMRSAIGAANASRLYTSSMIVEQDHDERDRYRATPAPARARTVDHDDAFARRRRGLRPEATPVVSLPRFIDAGTDLAPEPCRRACRLMRQIRTRAEGPPLRADGGASPISTRAKGRLLTVGSGTRAPGRECPPRACSYRTFCEREGAFADEHAHRRRVRRAAGLPVLVVGDDGAAHRPPHHHGLSTSPRRHPGKLGAAPDDFDDVAAKVHPSVEGQPHRADVESQTPRRGDDRREVFHDVA